MAKTDMDFNVDSDKRRQRVCRNIVRLVFIIYWLLIFEGALRKWFFPQWGNYLYFIRDPFVLITYYLAYRYKFWPRKSGLFYFGFSLSIFFLVIVVIQILTHPINPIIPLYGWRMYFLYFPLVFVIGNTFQKKDLNRLIRQTLLITIPMAILVYFQVKSPLTSFINRSAETGVFYSEHGLSPGAVIRSMGTFTFFHGYQLFLASCSACLLSVWFNCQTQKTSRLYLLFPATLAAAAMFAMDVTRVPVFLTLIIFLVASFGSFYLPKSNLRFRLRKLIITGCLISIISVFYLFPDIRNIRVSRLKEKDSLVRIKEAFTVFEGSLRNAPIFGYGLSLYSRAGQKLKNFQYPGTEEGEWSRIIMESGIIWGFLYIFLRIWLVFWLWQKAINSTRKNNNLLALVLFGFSGPVILVWYITHIGSVHGYGWLFAGFCAAASKIENQK